MNKKQWLWALGLVACGSLGVTPAAMAGEQTIYLPRLVGGRGTGTVLTATPSSDGTATPTATATIAASATSFATATPTAPATTTTTPITPSATATPAVKPTPYPGIVEITLGDPITVNGPGASVAGSTVTLQAGGVYRATGTLTDGMIAVDTIGDVTLILAGVAITHTSGPAINVTNAEKMSLVLEEGTTNTLVDGATYTATASEAKGALFSNDTLEISGDGALAVTGNYKHGIASDDDVIVESGHISIAAITDGIHANNNITVRGGTIAVTRAHDGLESEGTLGVAGGALSLAVADDGLASLGTLTVSGGSIEVGAGTEGIESKQNIVIDDGAITVTVNDDGLNAANDITVNGGQLYVNARTDALDSNGTLAVNGGLAILLGGGGPECGMDCDRCAIAINGGIVVAAGGSNSSPASTSRQRVAVLGSTAVGAVLRIERDGAEVLTYTVSKIYRNMIFTSPDLTADQSYTAYTGGTVSGGTDFHGLHTGATHSGGTLWNTFNTSAVVTYVGVTPGGRPGRP